jgi:hypothetical protein
MRLGRHQSRSRQFGEQKNLFLLPGFNPHTGGNATGEEYKDQELWLQPEHLVFQQRRQRID